jgi:hypothetical protein
MIKKLSAKSLFLIRKALIADRSKFTVIKKEFE